MGGIRCSPALTTDQGSRYAPLIFRKLARRFRINPTDAERRLWTKLRRRQLAGCKFRRQAPIGRYIVDFVCFPRKLIIEVDGGQHAAREPQDLRRSAWLQSQGFKVIRILNNDVLQNTEQVAELVLTALLERQPCDAQDLVEKSIQARHRPEKNQ